MLILKRKKNESILIGNDIRITSLECSSGEVRLAINAPKHLAILREELSEAESLNKAATMPDAQSLQAVTAALLPYLRKE